MRLDVFLSGKYNITRSLAQKYINLNYVYINNKMANKNNITIKERDIIHLKIPEINIEILWENENFLIAFKPDNMSCARFFNTPKEEKVLNEEIAKHYSLAKGIKPNEYGLPHRLDKETSGLIILVKNDKYFEQILNLFYTQSIYKEYLAFYEKPNKNIKLKFSTFVCKFGYRHFSLFNHRCFCNRIKKKPMNLFLEEKKDKVYVNYSIQDTMAAKASTVLIKRKKYYYCYPITGKRHQIRVFLNSLNKSIVGDKLYGNKIHDKMMLFATGLAIPLH
jgi:23S rRNA pseudouridine1911/1915/1917 synthase